MAHKLPETILETYAFCKDLDYAGWDPYDGLNSKVFQYTPLNNSAYFRMFWTQAFKHSPVNFRPIMMVKQGQNPKGLGLVLSSLCNIANSRLAVPDSEAAQILNNDIIAVADRLLELRSPGFEDFCWGYNFPWQSRAFYLPRWTPTVVCTSFVVDGLLAAYRHCGDERYLAACVSATRFASRGLNQIKTPTGIGFSYSPLDSRMVYNATLLGSRYLSSVSAATGDKALLEIAKSSIESTREAFSDDGSFDYARESTARWRDNFHTGFNLESLSRYRDISGDSDYDEVISKGTQYWLDNFFLEDGTCKYYDNKVFPLDVHCSSQVFPTIYHLGLSDHLAPLADKVFRHMLSTFYIGNGEFKFQVKKRFPINIRYFRWGTAWAFYGMSYYLKSYGNKLPT